MISPIAMRKCFPTACLITSYKNNEEKKYHDIIAEKEV